jgi:hypothetical protein
MAACSTSSSDSAPRSNDEKLVSLDSSDSGPPGIMREAERSSFMGQLNNSQKEKGLARVEVKRKTRAAERSSFKGQRNNSQKEKDWAIVSGSGETSIECGCCYWEYRVENMGISFVLNV